MSGQLVVQERGSCLHIGKVYTYEWAVSSSRAGLVVVGVVRQPHGIYSLSLSLSIHIYMYIHTYIYIYAYV